MVKTILDERLSDLSQFAMLQIKLFIVELPTIRLSYKYR